MSPKGRPEGESTPERLARRVVPCPKGRPEGESTPERLARRVVPCATATVLAERLAGLDPLLLQVDDDSADHVGHAGAIGGGGHFSLTIVSKAFCGASRLARHRAVLGCVGDLIPHPVHALAIRAYAPDEFASPDERKSR